MFHGGQPGTTVYAGIPQPSSRDPGFFHRRRDRTGQTTQEGVLISEGGTSWTSRKRRRNAGLVDASGKPLGKPKRRKVFNRVRPTGSRKPIPVKPKPEQMQFYGPSKRRRGKGYLLIRRKRGRGYYRKYPRESKRYFK